MPGGRRHRRCRLSKAFKSHAELDTAITTLDAALFDSYNRCDRLVVDARQSGRLMGRARLKLALQTVDVNGQNYDVRTISNPRIGRDHKKRDWEWIGGGAAGGAVIGAWAGGGTGALIGGPVGAGAGATVALVTGKKDIKLRAETPLKFELAEPVTINVKG